MKLFTNVYQVDRITICPFLNCLNRGASDINNAVLEAMSNHLEIDDGTNQEMLLEMHAHRYLPNEQVFATML